MTVAAETNCLLIVPAEPVAAETVARLQSAAFEKPWRETDVRALLTGPTALGFLAYWEAAPAGYIIARHTGDEAELLSLGTLTSFRRLGIGSALLNQLEFTLGARGTEKLFLEVDATNTAALKLYLGKDFRKIGTRKLYYKSVNGKRSDALVLRKTLAVSEPRGVRQGFPPKFHLHQET